MLQTQDLFDLRDLHVFHYRLMCSVSDIEKFPSQWKDTVIVTTHDAQSRDSKRLGGVSFSQDQCAFAGVSSTRIVGVLQLDDARDTKKLATTRLKDVHTENASIHRSFS